MHENESQNQDEEPPTIYKSTADQLKIFLGNMVGYFLNTKRIRFLKKKYYDMFPAQIIYGSKGFYCIWSQICLKMAVKLPKKQEKQGSWGGTVEKTNLF